jgi:hypothetical protein
MRPKTTLALWSIMLGICAIVWRTMDASAAVPSNPEQQHVLADHLITKLWGPSQDNTLTDPKTTNPSRPSKQPNLRTKLERVGKQLFGDHFADYVYNSNEQLIRACFASYYGEDSCDAVIAKILNPTEAKKP